MKNDHTRKKVLIFGAAGFVGRYLVNELIEHDYEVHCSDRDMPKDLPPEIQCDIADILDYSAIEHICCRIMPDIIVNLAGVSSVGKSWAIPQLTMQTNVIGAVNIMEIIRKHLPDTQALFIGSSEEYIISSYPMNEERSLGATNPYGISKQAQELYAKMYRDYYGCKIQFVRSFNHTGVGQEDTFVIPSWCKQVAEIERSGRPGVLKVGNLDLKRDFSHVKDIVRAYRIVIESEDYRLIYNVGSGVAYSLQSILDYIVSLSSQHITVEQAADRMRMSDQPIICCDNSLIKTQLGWTPERSVFEAIDEMYDYYLG